ncbi:MAG: M1 family metallopeptidase [Candidatus Kapabacteria bacterium]|nr:M1 family metallopeptidase [Candidatus Kapabacteria bacterium]
MKNIISRTVISVLFSATLIVVCCSTVHASVHANHTRTNGTAYRTSDFPAYCKHGLEAEFPNEPACRHAHSKVPQLMARRASVVRRQPYTVNRYDLEMDWRKPLTDSGSQARRYQGVNTITMTMDTSGTRNILLFARSLRIDSVFYNTTKLAANNITQRGDSLTIALPNPLQAKSQFVLKIYYTQTSSSNPGGFGGFNNFKKGVSNGDSIYENICYTMSQPNNARNWMPCNDQPYEKAKATITLRVPAGYTTCSNGVLENVITDRDGSLIYVWREDFPIPTYLMVAVASKFTTYTTWYKPANSTDSIPAPLFLWRQDSLEYAENVKWSQDGTAAMMKLYSGQYGEYPFKKYGTVLLFPYFTGGMEHQSMTTNARRIMTDRWESVIAHELMHQWTGDEVTCAAWQDIWLNEGGATYGEYLWIEANQSVADARRYQRNNAERSYFRGDQGASQPSVYAATLSNLFNNGTTYIKGGWIYHMLRKMVGDSLYFATMKKYMLRFSGTSLETEDMIAFFESEIPKPPVPFRTFFDQWVYERGHPYYDAVMNEILPAGNGEYDIKITFVQERGDPSYPIFTMPVTLRFYDQQRSTFRDYRFINDTTRQQLTVRMPFLPSTFSIDEDDDILCIKYSNQVTVSVAEEQREAGSHIQVAPNPATATADANVRYSVPADGMVTIEVMDILGRTVATVHNGFMPHGDYAAPLRTGGLAQGTYSVRMRCGDKYSFTSFTITD